MTSTRIEAIRLNKATQHLHISSLDGIFIHASIITPEGCTLCSWIEKGEEQRCVTKQTKFTVMGWQPASASKSTTSLFSVYEMYVKLAANGNDHITYAVDIMVGRMISQEIYDFNMSTPCCTYNWRTPILFVEASEHWMRQGKRLR